MRVATLQAITWLTAGLAPLILGSWWFSGVLLRVRSGTSRILGTAVLSWWGLTAGMILLGESGLLARVPLACWSCAWLALASATRWRWRHRLPVQPLEKHPSRETWTIPAVLAASLALWAMCLLVMPSLLLPAKVVSDGPIYHLYFAAQWWKAERLWFVPAPFGETAATYFPAGGDLWFCWLITFWGGDTLAKIGQAPFLFIAALALYDIARTLGAGRSASVLATAWFVSCQPLLLFSFEANVDTIFVAGYLASVAFLFHYLLRHPAPAARIWLAGLAAGLAWGTKPTAMAFVPPLLAIQGILILTLGPESRTLRIRSILVLALGALLGGGYWYARSWWLFGNPVYPLQVRVLGHRIFAGWYERSAMAESQFYIPFAIWKALVDIVLVVFDPRLTPFWILGLIGAWAWGRTASSIDAKRQHHLVWICAALTVLNVVLFWVLIPYRTQQRFMLQAVGFASIPMALWFDRARFWQWLGCALLAINLLTPQSWPIDPEARSNPWSVSKMIPGSALADIPLPLTAQAWDLLVRDSRSLAAFCFNLLVAAGALAIVILYNRWRATRKPASIGLIVLLAALIPTGLGWFIDSNVQPHRKVFPYFPDYEPAWSALVRIGPDTEPPLRIAYAGTNLPYFLMGKNLRNDVRYVNIDAHRDWKLHDYHRQALRTGDRPLWDTPRPGWDRLQPDFEAWYQNLNAWNIDLLVVARANPIDGPFNIADAEQFPIERVWADAHPDRFLPLWGVSERDRQMKIYGLVGNRFPRNRSLR